MNSKSQSIMKKKSFKQPAFLSIVCLLLGISLFWFTTSKIDDLKIEQDAHNTSFWTFCNMADEGKITDEKAQMASLSVMGMAARTEKEISTYAKAAGMPIAFRHGMRAAVILSFGLQCIL